MLPTVCVAFTGRDLLSEEAKNAIRDAWRSTYQLRGDTENHFAMYYTMLYLMSEMYPNESGDQWYTGKSSEENLAESRAYLIDWMDIMTTIGQGEFNPTHYIGEYAIPMLYLVAWAEDPEMRIRGKMVLDWLYAGLAANTLNGVLRGPNARTDDSSVVERWNSLSSFFSWLNFGNCPPTRGFSWGNYYAIVADNYDVPEVIYRIATDRDMPFEQRDLKRSRHQWRYSDVGKAPIYKTSYTTSEYAVGSYQGGMADPIQTHVWDVTWKTPDPRGIHPTMFSIHPYSASKGMQAYFNVGPDTMVKAVAAEGNRPTMSPTSWSAALLTNKCSKISIQSSLCTTSQKGHALNRSTDFSLKIFPISQKTHLAGFLLKAETATSPTVHSPNMNGNRIWPTNDCHLPATATAMNVSKQAARSSSALIVKTARFCKQPPFQSSRVTKPSKRRSNRCHLKSNSIRSLAFP